MHGCTSSLLAGPVLAQTLPGGILALPSNGGRRSDGEFTAVPEVEIKLGYQVGPYLSCTIGYNFLYWSRVVRPGQRPSAELALSGGKSDSPSSSEAATRRCGAWP